MAYNSKYTGEQVEALLDKAGRALSAYDISAIVAKASERDWTDITKEEFDAVIEAVVAKKTIWSKQTFSFDEDGTVVSYAIHRQYIPTLDTENETYRGVSLYTCNGYTYDYIRLYFSDESGYQIKAFSKSVPSKTSDLNNDSGFITSAALADYVKTAEVVKINESTIGFGDSYDAGIRSIELSADEFYVVGRSSKLNFTLPDGSDTDGKEYNCQFYVGNNVSSFTITLPDTVVWLNGEVPTFESQTCYMLSIVNHCAVIGVFKQA